VQVIYIEIEVIVNHIANFVDKHVSLNEGAISVNEDKAYILSVLLA
jgi:hypothetical protein